MPTSGRLDLEDGELVDQKVVANDHLAAFSVGAVEGKVQKRGIEDYVAVVADVDVRLVITQLLYSVEGEVIYAGGLYHVQEHVAGDQLLELQIVVDLGQEDLQKPLGMEGLPLVHNPVVS